MGKIYEKYSGQKNTVCHESEGLKKEIFRTDIIGNASKIWIPTPVPRSKIQRFKQTE